MAAPNDDLLQETLNRTGLINLVSSHSSGLDLPISEGGKGLSGGQKQLVAFTRLLLTKPDVFLLDEPTASMDNRQEQRCLQVLRQELTNKQTFIVSTHKTALLDLADRIIIMDNQRIIIDGPKQAVLDELRKNEQGKSPAAAPQNNKTAPQTSRPAVNTAPKLNSTNHKATKHNETNDKSTRHTTTKRPVAKPLDTKVPETKGSNTKAANTKVKPNSATPSITEHGE